MATDKRPKVEWTPVVYKREPLPVDKCDIHDMYYWPKQGCTACRLWLEKT